MGFVTTVALYLNSTQIENDKAKRGDGKPVRAQKESDDLG